MLQVKNITKTYGNTQVLSGVGFVLPDGQCLGLQGENGSGKSTLLRILAGLEKADSGEVLLDGKNLARSRAFRRKAVGYVPQSNMLQEELTVSQQLKVWQSACGAGGRLPQDLLDMLGLQPLLKTKTGVLSGGQQKRVSIAMAFMAKPRILLMDEVTASLDSDYTEVLFSCLQRHLMNRGSILWCSHNTAEFSRLCGAVLTMQDGKLR